MLRPFNINQNTCTSQAMFELEKTFTFEAGHVLKYHDGKCCRPHGHSYELTVKLRGDTLITEGPKQNMLTDFHDIDRVVEPMIDQYLDHRWLNDTLKTDSSTVEFISKWIYEYLEPHLPYLCAVTLNETPSSKVTYTKQQVVSRQ